MVVTRKQETNKYKEEKLENMQNNSRITQRMKEIKKMQGVSTIHIKDKNGKPCHVARKINYR